MAKIPQKKGAPFWSPEKVCLARQITMEKLIKEVKLARGPGLQSLDEIGELLMCGIQGKTLTRYMERCPSAPLTTAITRARAERIAFAKGKLSTIMSNDDHRQQARVLMWFVERQGGEEFAQKTRVEMSGAGGGPVPVERVKPMVSKRIRNESDKILDAALRPKP